MCRSGSAHPVATCGCAWNLVTRHNTSGFSRRDACDSPNSWYSGGGIAGGSYGTDVGGGIHGPGRTRGVCEERVRSLLSTSIPALVALNSHHCKVLDAKIRGRFAARQQSVDGDGSMVMCGSWRLRGRRKCPCERLHIPDVQRMFMDYLKHLFGLGVGFCSLY